MSYYYELIGVPEGASWVEVRRVRGRLVPIPARGNRYPFPRAEAVAAAAPLLGVEGYDWYLFKTGGNQGSVVYGWVPNEHRDSVFRISYHSDSDLSYRMVCIREALRRLPGSRLLEDNVRLLLALGDGGIPVHELGDSSRFSRSTRLSGRRPLMEMVLT